VKAHTSSVEEKNVLLSFSIPICDYVLPYETLYQLPIIIYYECYLMTLYQFFLYLLDILKEIFTQENIFIRLGVAVQLYGISFYHVMSKKGRLEIGGQDILMLTICKHFK
jgi:hypothetical protein